MSVRTSLVLSAGIVLAVLLVAVLSGSDPAPGDAPSGEPGTTLRLGEPCSLADVGTQSEALAIDGSAVLVTCRYSDSDGHAEARWYLS